MKITPSNLYEFDIRTKEGISLARNEHNFYLRKDGYSYATNITGAKILYGFIRERKLKEILKALSIQFKIEYKRIVQDTVEFIRELYLHGAIDIYKDGVKLNLPYWEATALEMVQVILSRRCNLRCAHCFITNYDIEEMSLEDLRLIFLQLIDRGTQFVHFTGGEILLRHDITKIFELATALGLDYGFNTNGTLISDNFINELSRMPPSDISISLYGHTSDIHEQITRHCGTFEKTCNAINLCLDAGFRVIVKTMVTKYNKEYLHEIAKFTEKLGVDQIIFDPFIIRKYDGDTTPWKYRVSRNDLSAFDSSPYGQKLKKQQRLPDSFICNAGITPIKQLGPKIACFRSRRYC